MIMESIEPDNVRSSKELVDRVTETVPRMQRNASQLDRENELPITEIEELRSAGALAAVLPVHLGGLGMGTEACGALYLYDLLWSIGRGHLAVGRIYEGHINAIVLITLYGNEEQLAQASRDALSGHLFAVWNTELPAGVHVVGSELRGSKIFCSAAGHARRAIITARDVASILGVPCNRLKFLRHPDTAIPSSGSQFDSIVGEIEHLASEY